ncbi:hypothetical protein CXG81DRAFT_28777 [Caulochytrium protostelioides]|uniref:RGS domain-containing protein n=1 Tax=Caulochytrium protostelioides TaxID=1555241 RepID=A0A4P9WUH1_9FUNG|nr:hypothetical protein CAUPRSCDRAFT_11395 [Caulochytrium protostelioides]RKO98386.1 hypothetical protein CXG81DRAFT_28777 [Caulochytrium protostelioides]|eukprot:RKO98386.1 hypothetical protein CXG81DRAFT_28777 [Caulochytrium protostelioides]
MAPATSAKADVEPAPKIMATLSMTDLSDLGLAESGIISSSYALSQKSTCAVSPFDMMSGSDLSGRLRTTVHTRSSRGTLTIDATRSAPLLRMPGGLSLTAWFLRKRMHHVNLAHILGGMTSYPLDAASFRDHLLDHEWGAESLDFHGDVSKYAQLYLQVVHAYEAAAGRPPVYVSPLLAPPSTKKTAGETDMHPMARSHMGRDVLKPLTPPATLSTIATTTGTREEVWQRYLELAVACRTHYERIVHTYIAQSASSEVNITSAQRHAILKALSELKAVVAASDDTAAAATHWAMAPAAMERLCPSVFLAAQRHVYHLMEVNSLPRFLAIALTVNISREERSSRWLLLATLVIGWIVYFALCLTLPVFRTHPQYRWIIVLMSFNVACLGASIVFGFCVLYGTAGRVRRYGALVMSLVKPDPAVRTDDRPIGDACVMAAHRSITVAVYTASALVSVIIGIILYFIPANLP